MKKETNISATDKMVKNRKKKDEILREVNNEELPTSSAGIEQEAELESVVNTEALQGELLNVLNSCGNTESVSFTYGYEDSLVMEDYRDRKIYINHAIDNEVADMIIFYILRYNAEDKGIPIEERKPIRIFLSTNGGDLTEGMACMSAIKNSKTPVWTISFGSLYSMGFHIFLTGSRRIITPEVTFLNHDGSYYIGGNTGTVLDNVKFYQEQLKRLNDYTIERTKITDKKLKQMERNEVFFFAEEALSLGIATDIIGVTADLDEIL